MDRPITAVYQSPKTIFTTKDLALIWSEINKKNLKSKISYYTKQKSLIRLSRGIFAKDANFNAKELANSIYTPSYISFETVLREAGVIFQHYDTIFVAGPWSLSRKIGNFNIKFLKLKSSLLFNPAGVINANNYSIATLERAFMDTIYLSPKFYFDNLRSLDWGKCYELLNIYDNQELGKRLNKYHQKYVK